MKKKQHEFARASVLQIGMSIALMVVSVVVLAVSFSGAPLNSIEADSDQNARADETTSTSSPDENAPAVIGTCDTAGPVEVEATAGVLGPTAYSNLGAAITAINAGTHQGAIEVEICGNTSESGSTFLNSGTVAPANYISVRIRPLNDGLTVSGPSSTGRGLIELNGASNVTIDGDNPNTLGTNRNLTIRNSATNTLTFTSVIRIAVNSSNVTSANNVTIKNLNIVGSATGRNISSATSTGGSQDNTYGVLASSGASGPTSAPSPVNSTNTGISAGSTVNNLLIQNNSVVTAARAVAAQASPINVFGALLIQDNVIGNATGGSSDQVTSFGITAQGSSDGVIRRNTVFVEGYLGTNGRTIGIDLGSAVTLGSVGSLTIEKNVIGRIHNNNPSRTSALGIVLAAGTNHVVRNNFVMGVANDQTNSGAGVLSALAAAGIQVNASSTSGHKIYHNTVYLCGRLTGRVGNNLVAALLVSGTSDTNMDIRDNIFANVMTGGNSTQPSTRLVAIYLPSGATSAMNLILNNNDYVEGTDANSRMAQVGDTLGSGEYSAANFDPSATFPANNFRAYTSTLSASGTNDLNSQKLVPLLVSCTDLHLTTNSPMLERGVNVGVTDDIDGDPRPNCSLPDIGADEVIQADCIPTPTPIATATPPLTPAPTGTPTVTPRPMPTGPPTATPAPTASPTPTPLIGCGTFSNPAVITIPASGTSGIAAPYPSNVNVSGLGGVITKVTVKLNGITHAVPADIDVLLVGPSGQNAVIMSDCSSGASGVNLVLDDAAGSPLPRATGGSIFTGTYQPTNRWECSTSGPPGMDQFPAPAPPTIGGSPLGTFIGRNPNGTWSLYVVDDGSNSGSVGSFGGGWAITIETDNCTGPTATPSPTPTPGGATHFSVTIQGIVNGGNFPVSVTALDASNNTVTNYSGTVHFTNSDAFGGLTPPDGTLTNGTGVFTASFQNIFGYSSISAVDTRDSTVFGTTPCTFVGKTMGTPSATPTPTPVPVVCNVTAGLDNINTLTFPTWLRQNNSGSQQAGGTGWFQGNTEVFTSQSGSTDSYIAANYQNGAGTTTLSDWLVMPPVTLQNGAQLSFWTRTVDVPQYPDRLQVRMSTNGTSFFVGNGATGVGDFATVLLDINPLYTMTDYPNNWTNYVITLGGIASPVSGRLAFRYFVENGGPAGANSDYIGIDTIQYNCNGGFPSPTPPPAVCSLSEGFNDLTTLLPNSWYFQNNSQPGPGTTGWFQGNTGIFTAQSGAANTYMAANYNSGTGTSTLSNWLLTPPLTVLNGGIFSFWTRTVSSPFYPDRLQLRLSTNGASTNVGSNGTSVGDFSTILLDINPTYTVTGYPNGWTNYTITLSGISSPVTGRLAFRYFVESGGPAGANSDYIGIDSIQYDCNLPTPTPVPTVSISGAISYCPNPAPVPVPGVTMTLTGAGSASVLSDASGNYAFSSVVVGDSCTVKPTKNALVPGMAGINTVDVIAVQRHYLNIVLLPPGCVLTAADVNGDAAITTVDTIAIQRFFLGRSFGVANVGSYQFNPESRSYSSVVSNQTNQNYDALVFGDVMAPFVSP